MFFQSSPPVASAHSLCFPALTCDPLPSFLQELETAQAELAKMESDQQDLFRRAEQLKAQAEEMTATIQTKRTSVTELATVVNDRFRPRVDATRSANGLLGDDSKTDG